MVRDFIWSRWLNYQCVLWVHRWACTPRCYLAIDWQWRTGWGTNTQHTARRYARTPLTAHMYSTIHSITHSPHSITHTPHTTSHRSHTASHTPHTALHSITHTPQSITHTPQIITHTPKSITHIPHTALTPSTHSSHTPRTPHTAKTRLGASVLVQSNAAARFSHVMTIQPRYCVGCYCGQPLYTATNIILILIIVSAEVGLSTLIR